MGSFNYSDDYSAFDNLLERCNYLTEGVKGRPAKIGSAHPSFAGLAGRLKKEVGKGFPWDIRIFIAGLLHKLHIFTDEEMVYLKGEGGAATKEYRLALEELLDAHDDEIKARSDEVGDIVEKEFPALVNINLTRMGKTKVALKKAENEAKKVAKDVAREVKSGRDLDDSVSDNVEKGLVNVAVFNILSNAQGRVSDKMLNTVHDYTVKLVNNFNDLDVLIRKLRTFDDEDSKTLADELSTGLSRAGVSQDDEDPYAGMNDPGDPEDNEYAMNQDEEVISRESLNNNMQKKKLLFEKDLDAAERRALPNKDFALPGKGEGPEGKQAGSYPIPDESHARSALSLVSQHGTPEEKKRVRAAVARKFPDIEQED